MSSRFWDWERGGKGESTISSLEGDPQLSAAVGHYLLLEMLTFFLQIRIQKNDCSKFPKTAAQHQSDSQKQSKRSENVNFFQSLSAFPKKPFKNFQIPLFPANNLTLVCSPQVCPGCSPGILKKWIKDKITTSLLQQVWPKHTFITEPYDSQTGSFLCVDAPSMRWCPASTGWNPSYSTTRNR